jgi:hypothetical protein
MGVMMLLRVITLACSLMAIAVVPTKASKTGDEVSDLLPKCKLFLEAADGKHILRDIYGEMTLPDAVLKAELTGRNMGECIGAVQTAGSLLSSIYPSCKEGIPAPLGVLIRTVVRYMDKRPDQLHEPFVTLTYRAILETWPCEHTRRQQ